MLHCLATVRDAWALTLDVVTDGAARRVDESTQARVAHGHGEKCGGAQWLAVGELMPTPGDADRDDAVFRIGGCDALVFAKGPHGQSSDRSA